MTAIKTNIKPPTKIEPREPVTNTGANGRIFIDMTKRDVARLINNLTMALSETETDDVPLEVSLFSSRFSSTVAIGSRSGGLLVSAPVVDSGMYFQQKG